MSSRYLIPAVSRHRVEESIKRSRFIATLAHVQCPEEARAFVAEIKEEFPDATHNCWAFAAGSPGETAHVGLSDDGEPHGTAGKPMLNALLHSGVGEIAAVVTRYFGGVKLGTGGLVRAYSGLVSLGLESLPTKEKVELSLVQAVIPYTFVTLFKRMLPDFEAEVAEESFEVDASFLVRLPSEHVRAFEKELLDMTKGEALFSPSQEHP
ncbi:YigZ family protein [Salidesulfovibrio onnuriiensis]|uniref:YigZ family protein n=1 Tax=Salidesulfovibrio onnuriiensis TaxID=2583823 RepID=UPI0011C91E9E|nr:YigZ family protein [Salidesulfovibrio onnuriiensis]